jgi:hypothetical protein
MEMAPLKSGDTLPVDDDEDSDEEYGFGSRQYRDNPRRTRPHRQESQSSSASFRDLFEPFENEITPLTTIQRQSLHSRAACHADPRELSIRDMLSMEPLDDELSVVVTHPDSKAKVVAPERESSIRDMLSIEPLDDEVPYARIGSLKSEKRSPTKSVYIYAQEPQSVSTDRRRRHQYSDAELYGTKPSPPKSLDDLRRASALVSPSPNEPLNRPPLVVAQSTETSWNHVMSGLTQEGLVTESDLVTKRDRIVVERKKKQQATSPTKSTDAISSSEDHPRRQGMTIRRSVPSASNEHPRVQPSKRQDELQDILDSFVT